MKLSQLFERKNSSSEKGVDIEFEYEFEDDEGNYDSEIIRFGVDVVATADAHNTGDSPTDHDAKITSATVVSTKKPFNWKKLLTKTQIKGIIERAVEKAQ